MPPTHLCPFCNLEVVMERRNLYRCKNNDCSFYDEPMSVAEIDAIAEALDEHDKVLRKGIHKVFYSDEDVRKLYLDAVSFFTSPHLSQVMILRMANRLDHFGELLMKDKSVNEEAEQGADLSPNS